MAARFYLLLWGSISFPYTTYKGLQNLQIHQTILMLSKRKTGYFTIFSKPMRTPISVHKCVNNWKNYLNHLHSECEFNIQLVVNIVFIGFENIVKYPVFLFDNMSIVWWICRFWSPLYVVLIYVVYFNLGLHMHNQYFLFSTILNILSCSIK